MYVERASPSPWHSLTLTLIYNYALILPEFVGIQADSSVEMYRLPPLFPIVWLRPLLAITRHVRALVD